MQSVWLESGVTGIEDVLKAAYSRLRDAESTASAAKIRAIALHGEASRAKRRAGSSARIDALDRRENALDRRESALASEIVALESTVARAREESEAVRRDAARVAADAESRLAVAEMKSVVCVRCSPPSVEPTIARKLGDEVMSRPRPPKRAVATP